MGYAVTARGIKKAFQDYNIVKNFTMEHTSAVVAVDTTYEMATFLEIDMSKLQWLWFHVDLIESLVGAPLKEYKIGFKIDGVWTYRVESNVSSEWWYKYNVGAVEGIHDIDFQIFMENGGQIHFINPCMWFIPK